MIYFFQKQLFKIKQNLKRKKKKQYKNPLLGI